MPSKDPRPLIPAEHRSSTAVKYLSGNRPDPFQIERESYKKPKPNPSRVTGQAHGELERRAFLLEHNSGHYTEQTRGEDEAGCPGPGDAKTLTTARSLGFLFASCVPDVPWKKPAT